MKKKKRSSAAEIAQHMSVIALTAFFLTLSEESSGLPKSLILGEMMALTVLYMYLFCLPDISEERKKH